MGGSAGSAIEKSLDRDRRLSAAKATCSSRKPVAEIVLCCCWNQKPKAVNLRVLNTPKTSSSEAWNQNIDMVQPPKSDNNCFGDAIIRIPSLKLKGYATKANATSEPVGKQPVGAVRLQGLQRTESQPEEWQRVVGLVFGAAEALENWAIEDAEAWLCDIRQRFTSYAKHNVWGRLTTLRLNT